MNLLNTTLKMEFILVFCNVKNKNGNRKGRKCYGAKRVKVEEE